MNKHALLMSVAEAAALSGLRPTRIRGLLKRGWLQGHLQCPMRVSPSSYARYFRESVEEVQDRLASLRAQPPAEEEVAS